MFYQCSFHPDVCLLSLIVLMQGQCAWQVEGMDNSLYRTSHHGIWMLSIFLELGWICCCAQATLFSSNFSVAPFNRRKLMHFKKESKELCILSKHWFILLLCGLRYSPCPLPGVFQGTSPGLFVPVHSSELRSCKFTALEMESTTQRRGELHVTADGMPTSAVFPLRNKLTLQQRRLRRPFQVQIEIKHWDWHSTELLECPSLSPFKKKIGIKLGWTRNTRSTLEQ